MAVLVVAYVAEENSFCVYLSGCGNGSGGRDL